MAITRRQKEVLDFIAAYQVENGYSPSYEEIARGLKLASDAGSNVACMQPPSVTASPSNSPRNAIPRTAIATPCS